MPIIKPNKTIDQHNQTGNDQYINSQNGIAANDPIVPGMMGDKPLLNTVANKCQGFDSFKQNFLSVMVSFSPQ